MSAPAFPSDEFERLEALHASGLLDTPTEERFDRITRLAQRFFDVPIAVISLVDRDRQWFKSRQGLDVCETNREISFCGHAILDSKVFVIPDATRDERFRENPLVTDEPHIRFYAGCPISTREGRRIGTICIIDHVPRSLDENQLQLLTDLAKLVEREVSASSPPGDGSALVTGTVREGSGFRVPRRGWLAYFVSGLGGRMGASICALIAAGLVVGISMRWDHHNLVAHRTEVQSETLDRLTALRGRLESTLNSKLHLVYGLSGFVNARGQVDEPAFQRFAPRLKGELKGVASLQLAPNGVVTHIWPLAGNEAARGHDLLADPKRREAALRAIRERRFIVAGPVNLRQGGTALIGRLPIFLRDSSGEERFWGFSIVLVDFPTLIREAGIETEGSGKQSLAIRGKHGLGEDGEPFFGDPSLFNQPSIKSDVVLPSGSWQLAAMPPGGWPAGWPGRSDFLIVSGFFALIAGGLVYFFLRLPSRLRKAVREATGALGSSQAQFRDAIEALPDGFVIFDSDDRLVLCNDTYRRFYKTSLPVIKEGRTFEEIIRYGFEHGQYVLSEEEKHLDVDALVKRRLQRHRNPGAPIEQLLDDGRWVQIVERRMRDGGLVGFRVDITELKLKERELLQAKERAEASNQAKSTFLATVSHEVRTPLNGVLGLLGLVRESELDGQQRRYLDTAYISGQNLLQILNEILDISKMEAGTLELQNEDFDTRALIESVANLIRPQCNMRGLEFDVQLRQGVPDRLRGDSGRIRQILLNLCNNAVKFTDQGRIQIVIDSQADDGDRVQLTFEVSDTGIGIPEEKIPLIFERFTQLDASPARRHGGAGLGLTICKRLVEAMGGEIQVQSVHGKGSTFRVRLGLDVSLQASPEPALRLKPRLPGDVPGRKFRVLLAEDSLTNQMVVKGMLENTGYVVDVVANGEEAVAAVSSLPYDAVLMDVSMPEMDGLEATRRIRTLKNSDVLPIIALTASAMPDDEKQSREAGMDDFLSKPVDKRKLLLALARCVGI